METVLTAFIVIFLLIFAVLTLTGALLDSQAVLVDDWYAMQARLAEQSRTSLAPLEARVLSPGSEVELTLRNTGTVRLADFDRWDLFVEYYSDTGTTTYQIARLPYASPEPISNQWGVVGLFMDPAGASREVFEPGIFNPDEVMIVRVVLLPPVGSGGAFRATLATPDGVTVSTMGVRNAVPVLAVNAGLIVQAGDSVPITSAMLSVSDADDAPSAVAYTVITPPGQGTLSLSAFTQADVDAGLLTYTHTGSGSDSFTFTVTDGEDSIRETTFVMTVP